MITGNIKDAKRYYPVVEGFREAFEILASLTPDVPCGVVTERDGFRISVMENVRADLDKNGNPRVFEAHRNYLDIHFVISGEEGMGYADISKLTVTKEYDESGDYLLLSGDYDKLILKPGDFCITFPEDAHIPAMTAGGEGLKKAVVKIRL